MTGPKRKLTGAALVGRRIGIGVFWCLAVFVAIASTRSVLLDLYGNADMAGKPGQPGNDTRCASELRDLHTSLLDQASAELRTHEGDLAQTQRWLRDWDARYIGTREICAGMLVARDDLERLRRRMEKMLRDYVREQRPLTQRIQRELSHTDASLARPKPEAQLSELTHESSHSHAEPTRSRPNPEPETSRSTPHRDLSRRDLSVANHAERETSRGHAANAYGVLSPRAPRSILTPES